MALLIGLAITLAIGMPAGLVQQQDARGIVVHGADASGASGASAANANGVNGKNTGGVNGTNADGANGVNANGANGVNANGANGYLFFLVYLPNVLFF